MMKAYSIKKTLNMRQSYSESSQSNAGDPSRNVINPLNNQFSTDAQGEKDVAIVT
jgi:hypothetical protein